MCGIFFALLKNHSNFNVCKLDFDFLKKRGPDWFSTRTEIIQNNNLILAFAASVLSLRGGEHSQVTQQPLFDVKTGNVLVWNGEIFDSDFVSVEEHSNDGQKLFDKLNENDSDQHLFKIFESIKGPYGFLYYNKINGSIYFGRDRLGRRSLLFSTNKIDSNKEVILTVSSVKVQIDTDDYQELKANGIYKLDLNDPYNLLLFKWENCELSTNLGDNLRISDLPLRNIITRFNENISGYGSEVDKDLFERTVESFYEILKKSVQRRCQNIPNLCKSCANHQTKFSGSKIIKCPHAKIAVLFSGGVDSTVLAALLDLFIDKDEPIDLLNIAFEKPKKESNTKKQRNLIEPPEEDKFLVPDRISGLESFKELNPNRKWNFIHVNIGLEELRHERENVIKHLLYPHQTVLDDSIGCAVWFASRGKGFLKNDFGEEMPYTSNAEVLILGMGIDEQLGGYVRHRTKYEKDGLEALCEEIKMEMSRISERNLGRDDRIISDHGKESRLPYLDEDVISFLNNLEIGLKCNMNLPRGTGEKLLLRHLAASRLGLHFASKLEKRAIQFGSRVAKLENSKEKASDVCNRISHSININQND